MTDTSFNDSGVTCEVIADLMPLVKDGVASEDSERLLKRHIETCETCRELYSETGPSQADRLVCQTDDRKIMTDIRKKYVLFIAFIMIIGAVVGVLFIDTEFIFQNFLLMPLVGALSYVCFRQKGAVMAGAVTLLSMLRGALFLLSPEPGNAAGSAVTGFIMGLFVLMGFFAAWLLAFAFRRETKDNKNDIGGKNR